MKHGSTRALYNYWMRLRKDRPAPERRDIEPADIRQILPDVYILEYESNSVSRFRLAGTRVCALYGRELKGENICTMWHGRTQRTFARLLDGMRGDPVGAVVGFDAVTQKNNTIACELLALPLLHLGNIHSRVIGVIVPTTPTPLAGLGKITSQQLTSLRYLFPATDKPFALEPASDSFWPRGNHHPTRRIGHLTVYEGGKRLA